MKIWFTPTENIPENEVKRFLAKSRKEGDAGDFPHLPSAGAVVPAYCWSCDERCWGSVNNQRPCYCPDCQKNMEKKKVGF